MLKRMVSAGILILFISSFLFAEDTPPPPEEKTKKEEPLFKFALGIALGYDVFSDTESYQKLSLKPDFGIGEFGIGLELTLHYRFTNGGIEIRSEDWVIDETHSFWDLYLPIFRYIRWSQKGHPLYIKFGSIEDMTLGNGYVMANYANTLFMPKTRVVGLNVDLDGALFNFPLVGFESVIGNISAMDVIGARLYVRPMVFFDIPILKNLQIGATFAVDRLPFRYVAASWAISQGIADPASAMAQAFGLDFRQPILTATPFTFAVYGDLVWLNGGTTNGQMLGVGGKIIDIFLYSLQFRFNGSNFIPVYFDATYDISRAVKYPLVQNGSAPGYAGWFASLGVDIFDIFTFSIALDGPFGYVDPLNANDYLNYPHLRGIIKLEKGLVPGLTADFIYDKTLLGKSNGFFADLFSPEGALITAKINYQFGPAMITLLYEIRYVPDATGNPWEITSGLETSVVIPF